MKKKCLIALLEDDLPSSIISAISTLAPKAANWLFNKFSNTSFGKKALSYLPDLDLNDDTGYSSGNKFS